MQAQTQTQPAPLTANGEPAQPQRQFDLSRPERAALAPVIQAAQASNWAAAQAALPAAQAAAHGNDAKYIVGQLQVQIGLGTQNTQLQAAGVDAMIASGSARPDQMVTLYNNQANFAVAAGDLAKADRALDQVVSLSTNDPLAVARAAQLFVDHNNVPHALEYYRHSIAAQEAAGHPVAPEVRRLQLATAYRAHSPETLALSRAYLAAAPSTQGWHDALAIYRELTPGVDDRLSPRHLPADARRRGADQRARLRRICRARQCRRDVRRGQDGARGGHCAQRHRRGQYRAASAPG